MANRIFQKQNSLQKHLREKVLLHSANLINFLIDK